MTDINAVGWQDFHPSGQTVYIPALVASLTSDDADLRLAAWDRLRKIVATQGVRTEASVRLVPFLVDLVGDPAVAHKDVLTMLLVDLAVGDENWHLHNHRDWPAWRREVERKQSLTVAEMEREFREWAATEPESRRDALIEGLEFRHFDVEREVEVAGLRCYDAVRAAVPAYVDLLRSDNALYRMYAAYLLGFFPDDRAITVPALVDLLREGEAEPGITATACVAAGLVGREGDQRLVEVLTPYLSSSEAVERWSAAIGLASVLPAPDLQIMAAICDCAFDGPTDLDYFPLRNGNLADVAVLAYVDARDRSPATRALLLRRLDRPFPGRHVLQLAIALLEEFFPRAAGHREPPRRRGGLTVQQHQAAVGLAQLRVLASGKEAPGHFRRHGLPGTQAELEDWITPPV